MKICSIENFEMLLSKGRRGYLFATNPNSNSYKLVIGTAGKRSVVPIKPKRNVSLFCNDKSVFKYSNLKQELLRRGVDWLFLGDRSSDDLERWSKRSGVELLVTPWPLQRKLEDKVFFHNLLLSKKLPVPPGDVISGAKDLKGFHQYPAVLQVPFSHASEGTYFVDSHSDTKRIIDHHKLRYPLLLRKKLSGRPLGITILVGNKRTIFSGVRLQCVVKQDNRSSVYYGIQWVPYRELSNGLRKNIESKCLRLSSVLRSQGFRGVANVDFIASENDISFIECNPRLSGSTYQASLKGEVLHGKDLCAEMINIFTEGDLSADIPRLPLTNFAGCTINLDYLFFVAPGKFSRKKHKSPSGVYNLTRSKLTFTSSDAMRARKTSSILLLSPYNVGEKISYEIGVGMAIANKPYFKYTQGSVRINELGRKVLPLLEELLR